MISLFFRAFSVDFNTPQTSNAAYTIAWSSGIRNCRALGTAATFPKSYVQCVTYAACWNECAVHISRLFSAATPSSIH